MSDGLKLVELHPGKSQKLVTLHDRILDVIDEYVKDNPGPVTINEVIGTLEFVKLTAMRVIQ